MSITGYGVCTWIFGESAPGPDPFAAIKDETSVIWVETFLRESLRQLHALVPTA